MATTTLKPYGGPGPAYGTIAGKAPAADGPHNPGAITTLWAWGGPGGRRTFADKAPAEVVTAEVVGGDDVPWGFQTGSKRRGSKRKRRTDAERIAELQRVYARVMGEAEPAAAVVAAVQPYVEAASDARVPPVEAIDWRGLLRDLDAIAVLLQYEQAVMDDDAAITLLLLT